MRYFAKMAVNFAKLLSFLKRGIKKSDTSCKNHLFIMNSSFACFTGCLQLELTAGRHGLLH